jgi:hypothetical protein
MEGESAVEQKTPKTPRLRQGEVLANVEHKKRGEEMVVESGRESLPPVIGNGELLDSTATGGLGMTIQPKQYESLRVDVGGSIPCTRAQLEDGSAYEALFKLLGKTLTEIEQKERARWAR